MTVAPCLRACSSPTVHLLPEWFHPLGDQVRETRLLQDGVDDVDELVLENDLDGRVEWVGPRGGCRGTRGKGRGRSRAPWRPSRARGTWGTRSCRSRFPPVKSHPRHGLDLLLFGFLWLRRDPLA